MQCLCHEMMSACRSADFCRNLTLRTRLSIHHHHSISLTYQQERKSSRRVEEVVPEITSLKPKSCSLVILRWLPAPILHRIPKLPGRILQRVSTEHQRTLRDGPPAAGRWSASSVAVGSGRSMRRRCVDCCNIQTIYSPIKELWILPSKTMILAEIL